MSYPRTDHFNGEKFFNPEHESNKGFGSFLKWQLSGGKVPWPKTRENKVAPRIPETVAEGKLANTFINHATHLLQFPEAHVLTDPVFSVRTSPVQWAGPKRVREPGVALTALPKIHVVVISHNHYDHMDSGSIRSLTDAHDPLFLVPLGNAKALKNFGARNVVELDWWQDHQAHGLKITLVPALHWSARGMFDRNKTLWGGFVIQNAKHKVFFAGDTGYHTHFTKIRERLGIMDLSLLPIGAYEPRWFMKDHHMNPEEAVQAHLDLGSKLSQGTHFGTFPLTDEGIDDPVQALVIAREKLKVAADRFLAPDNGETLLLE